MPGIMRRVIALVFLLAPGVAAGQDFAARSTTPPNAPELRHDQTRVDEAFADHEARAHRLMAVVCLGCGTEAETDEAPALAIPELLPAETPTAP